MLNNAETETVGKLFEYAIELERATESLYKQLERMFSNYPEVALFWKNYANEERGHAEYLERIRNGIDIDRLSRQADSIIFAKARQCFNKTAQVRLENIKTLEDAFQLATEVENAETNTVFEFMIVNFSTDELAKSHKFLRTQLSSHIARLENDFPNPYKSRIARQNVFAIQ
jgi:rubrerythrin